MAGMPKSAQVAIRSSGSEAPSRKLKAERALSSTYPDIRLLFSYTQIMQQRRRAVKLVIVSVKPKHSIRVYPCPSVAQNQPSKADRTSKKTSDFATDGHGYTRMRSVGFLACPSLLSRMSSDVGPAVLHGPYLFGAAAVSME